MGADKVIGIQGLMTPPRSAWLGRAGRGDNYLLRLRSPAGRAVGRRERDLQATILGVGCHALLQGIFPTQGLNLDVLHNRQILYGLIH